MSQKPQGTDTVKKLIAIRREALDVLRQDVLRLRQMQSEAETSYESAQRAQTEFLEEIRESERGSTALFVDRMQDRRRYLAYLEMQIAEAADVVDVIARQRQQAQTAFEACHKEVKALERLVERRDAAIRQILQRQELLRADDEELVRGQRHREAHDIGYR